MRKLKAQGIPVVALMIAGRPLYVNPALNLADAFVMAWLPGSEGGGIADVVIGASDGSPRYDFTGTLPAAWPRTASLADGKLFDLGFGLDYAATPAPWVALPEIDPGVVGGDSRMWFAAGAPAARWSLLVYERGTADQTRVTTVPAEALGGRARITAENFKVQEGARRFTISGGSSSISLRNFEPVNIDKETNGDVLLLVTARVWRSPDRAMIGAIGDTSQGFAPVALPPTDGFVRYGIPLKCLREKGADVRSLTEPFVLSMEGAADLAIGEVRLGSDAEVVLPCA